MSTEVIRELFRNLETTLHDRLRLIEDILSATKQSSALANTPSLRPELEKLERHLQSLEEYSMGEVRTLAYNHDQLEKRVEMLERSMRSAAETFQTMNNTMGLMQKRIDEETPVEAAEVEAEIEEAQEAALNGDIDPIATEKKAQVALAKAVEELVDEEGEEVEEEVEEEEVEEEVEEEEVEEEEVEEDLEIEEFTYKKKTWWRDQHNNVYTPNDDGAVDPNAVVGVWNPETKKIEAIP